MSSKPVRKQGAYGSYDFTWARRVRHAFRLIVLLIFVFTFALWFSEGYLRYDRSETQYRMSLTLHPAQARPILRTVVRRETEQNEVPPSRYLEALAQVEEADKVLDNYELAYKANPRNADLIINYGCILYMDGQPEEARERFREAGVNPPRNVLPRYLEAAALTATMAEEDDLSDVIALLTRANASEDPVLFPDPLWHESLPTKGARYQKQRRLIALQVALPLRECTANICKRARESIDRGAPRDWDNWLNAIAIMGMRLRGDAAADSPETLPQLVAALQIQQEATLLRADISKLYGGVVAAEINDTLLKLEEALKGLKKFDATYEQRLNGEYYRFRLPMILLLESLFAFLVFYSIGWFFHYLGSGGKSARAVPHVWIGKAVPTVGLGLMLALLLALMVAHNRTPQAEWEYQVPFVWRCLLGAMLAFGAIYPPLLAKMSQMNKRGAELTDVPEKSEKIRFPLRHYVGIYGCLLRRYMGVLIGGLIIMVCLWLIIYRVAFNMYPFQTDLIASGVGMETEVLLKEIRQYLAAP